LYNYPSYTSVEWPMINDLSKVSHYLSTGTCVSAGEILVKISPAETQVPVDK